MIGIKKNTEYLDLIPGTQIQRERENPIFLTSTDDGKDGIPGEISFPFSLPLTDKNLRLLNNIDTLPSNKVLEHDIILEDAGIQISAGKLVIESLDGHLVKNNVGRAEGFILSNVSEFWRRVKDKKLSDLSLGGNRVYTWDGYNTSTGTGFWKHVHDTWAYADSDDGDYVFYPVHCTGWKAEGESHFINGWQEYATVIEMARDENLTSLVPHPYLVYVIKQMFLENGYSIEGDILNDADFKQLTLVSYKGCHWANEGLDTTSWPTVTKTANPLPTITLKLSEHVPPEISIGEFMVEMQKFLPITFLINDNQKKCRIIRSDQVQGAGAKNRNTSFNPNYTLSFNKIDQNNQKVYGLARTYDDEYPTTINLDEYNYQGEVDSITDLPTPNSTNVDQVYYVRFFNKYYQNFRTGTGVGTYVYVWLYIADNLDGYSPEGETEALNVNITPLALNERPIFTGATLGEQYGFFPDTTRQGNWHKPYILAADYRVFTPWGLRVMFYRGKRMFKQIQEMPFATNDIYNINSHPTIQTTYPAIGAWSLSYEVGNYGMFDTFWKAWLPILETGENLKGTLYLKFHEYIQWQWDDVLLIHNTPYLIKKITEVLPFTGKIQIEAVRLPI